MLEHDRLLVQILLIALFGACLWVMAPFWSALFWAAVLAFASWPLMHWLTHQGVRTSMAAGLLTCGWMLIVVLPMTWLGFNLADQIRAGMALLRDLQVEGLPPPPDWLGRTPVIGDGLLEFWQRLDEQGTALFATVKPYTGMVGNWLLARSAAIGGVVLEMAVSLILVFFFYRDGPALVTYAHGLLARLIGERSAHYMHLVAGTVQRVVNGVIGTAAAQAALAFIGLMIAGVPGAVLLALATFGLSLIPMGPPLVWGPAALWLAWQGSYGMAIFLGLWGLLVISSVDNFLKPYLISRGGNLPLVIVLLGVFGGIMTFGFMGLFLGPTLLAVAYSLIGDWVSNQPDAASRDVQHAENREME